MGFILEIISPNKGGAYVINLDEYTDVETHWMALHALNNNVVYFDSFGVEHVSKEIENLLEIKTEKQTYLEYKQMFQ